MKKVTWTDSELDSVKSQLLAASIPEAGASEIIARLSGKAPIVRGNTDKGVKIALKRRANQLRISYDVNTVDKAVKLSNFTGTDADLAALREIATAHGYELV